MPSTYTLSNRLERMNPSDGPDIWAVPVSVVRKTQLKTSRENDRCEARSTFWRWLLTGGWLR